MATSFDSTLMTSSSSQLAHTSDNVMLSPEVTEWSDWQYGCGPYAEPVAQPIVLVPVYWVSAEDFGTYANPDVIMSSMALPSPQQSWEICNPESGHCDEVTRTCVWPPATGLRSATGQAETGPMFSEYETQMVVTTCGSFQDEKHEHVQILRGRISKTVEKVVAGEVRPVDDAANDEEACDMMEFRRDPVSYASSDASTAVSCTAKRRRGRRIAKTKAAKEAETSLHILESPPCDKLLVTAEIKTELSRQLEAGGQEADQAFSVIHDSALRMACEPFGCRVVQLALDVVDASKRELLAADFHGHVVEAISSPHANFVLQKVVEVLPVASVSFVAEELSTLASDVARHRYGCRIICRLVEHHLCSGGQSSTADKLIDELLLDAEKLLHHNFARHVLNLILEHGNGKHQHRIATAVLCRLFQSARSRHASYVVEQALIHCSATDRDAIAIELLRDTRNFVTLARHECGNHVVRALMRSKGIYAQQAREVLFAEADTLNATKYGKRLLDEMQ